eukprot:scaffold58556_cov46-Phaeocystis_antarctica.AAC.3
MRAVASEVGRRTSCTCSEFGEEDIGHATQAAEVRSTGKKQFQERHSTRMLPGETTARGLGLDDEDDDHDERDQQDACAARTHRLASR